jgi:uncharacterized protein (DUF1800 family)
MFRDNRYNVKVALRALLTSDAFYAAQNRAALIKSPVDLIVGTLRQFRFETGDVTPLVFASRQLGQDLFAPPNVKGWPGAEAWINSATLLQRKQMLERLFRAQEPRAPAMTQVADGQDEAAKARDRVTRAMLAIRFDADKWQSQFRTGSPLPVRVLLAGEPVNTQAAEPGLEGLRQLVLDPAYQLK